MSPSHRIRGIGPFAHDAFNAKRAGARERIAVTDMKLSGFMHHRVAIALEQEVVQELATKRERQFAQVGAIQPEQVEDVITHRANLVRVQ